MTLCFRTDNLIFWLSLKTLHFIFIAPWSVCKCYPHSSDETTEKEKKKLESKKKRAAKKKQQQKNEANVNNNTKEKNKQPDGEIVPPPIVGIELVKVGNFTFR